MKTFYKGPLAPSVFIRTEFFFISPSCHVVSFCSHSLCMVTSAVNSMNFMLNFIMNSVKQQLSKKSLLLHTGCAQYGKQTERNSPVVCGWLFGMRWALRFDGAEEYSCRRHGCSFWRHVRVGSQAALPHLRDAVIIVAGLSEQTGVVETDRALEAGLGVCNTCTTRTSNMFPTLASWWQVNDRNDQWHHI